MRLELPVGVEVNHRPAVKAGTAFAESEIEDAFGQAAMAQLEQDRRFASQTVCSGASRPAQKGMA
jgi:hypothetical protein